MTERRDYVGLDWVSGEIAESLEAAQEALQSFIDEPNDSTRLHFCLAHIHQVQGSLQMVEFFGFALLAEEMELLVNAVLDGEIADNHVADALMALKRALAEMPGYLGKVRESRREFPTDLVLAFNELRSVRGMPLLSTVDLFAPDIEAGTVTDDAPLSLSEQEFLDIAKKLRQMYQVALLGYFRGHETRKNLNYMAKVCARLVKLCRGHRVQHLWTVCIALLEGLLNNSIYSGFAIRNMLRRVDKEIRLFVDAGQAVLDKPLPEVLLRDMLFYIATSNAQSNYIRDIRSRYQTDSALPDLSGEAPASTAMNTIREALSVELQFLANAAARGDYSDSIRVRIRNVLYATGIIGLTAEYKVMRELTRRLEQAEGASIASPENELRRLAEGLREPAQAPSERSVFNDSEEAQQQLDRAYMSVVRESRNGLELAKEAVVNYVANQWQTDYLRELPELLGSIRGSLVIAELHRAANVMNACRRFVREQLIEDPHTPDWQTLDALADALTSVDYYLERCASDVDSADEEVLSVAERCVAQLGYAVSAADEESETVESERPALKTATAEPERPAAATIGDGATAEADTEAGEPAEGAADEDEDFDPEVVEIFIEEADEVLDTIGEFRPTLDEQIGDEEALGEIRRGFHTLKGSGRMVGAEQIGELAWSIENMLNRVLDQKFSMDSARLALVDECVGLLPALIKSFSDKQRHDAASIAAIVAKAEALAEAQSPDLSALDAEPEPEPTESEDALADIFVAEARIHLQVVENFLARAEAPVEVPDAVQRSLHTLKGAANMAEMFTVAGVISPLEKYIKELRALRMSADVDTLMLLRDVVSSTNQAIDRIEAGDGGDMANAEVLGQRIDALHRRLLLKKPDDERDAGGTLAPGELDGFMIETADWLAATRHTLNNHTDAGSLHRLADSAGIIARRADNIRNLQAIAELTGALRDLLREAREPVPEQAVTLAREATVELDRMLNQLAAEQAPAASALTQTLRNFDYSATLDDFDSEDPGQVPAEAPVLEGEADNEVSIEAVATPESEDELAQAEEIDYPGADDIPLVTETLAGENDEAVEEITLSAPSEEDEESVDPDVAAIFLEEAEELLEGIDSSIQAWSDSAGSQRDLNSLLRHLHTLKGGARMAGLSALGNYAHEFESFVESAVTSGDSNSDQFMPRLLAYQDTLADGVERVARGERFQPPQAAPSSRPQDQAETAPEPQLSPEPQRPPAALDDDSLPPETAAAVAASREGAAADEIDPEVVSIFLEEADDLVEAIDDAIQYWTGDRENEEHLDLLQRHLHTLKGGARLAGLGGLGDVTHDFETYINQSSRRDDDFLSQMLVFQDRVNEGVQAAQQGNTDWQPDNADLPASVAVAQQPEPAAQPLEQIAEKSSSPVPAGGDRRPATMESQMPQEMIKVSAQLMENLVNLAGETSISRGRAEEQVAELTSSLDEMAMTVERLQEQVRRLDLETEAQILFRQEQVSSEQEGFDPLEFDRYSQLQQLSRSLLESSSDLMDIRSTLGERTRDMETLLLQQGRINTELQEGLMRSRMVHFTRMIPRLRRIVRQVSLEIGKRVEFKVYNAEGELDRQVLERIIPPLEHMLRNAVDHGIETAEERRAAGKDPVGSISMRFGREGGDVLIHLIDDGAGINFEKVREKAVAMGLVTEDQAVTEAQLSDFLFEAGFSTASEVTQISGRGVGMDVVYSEIKQLGGSIEVESIRGQGSRFLIRLPFTVSVNRALMVGVGGDIYAIPINTVEGVVRVSPYELEVYYQPNAPAFEYANQSYSLRYLGGLLGTLAVPHLEGQTEPRPVLLARGTEKATAVQVDSILGSREIVVKSLGAQFSHVHGLSGATVLGDGSVVVIVDIPALLRADLQRGRDAAMLENKPQQIGEQNRLVMVVDDSVTVRKVTSRLLERQGMDVMLAKDGVDAVTQLQTAERLPDIILLDIEMPRMDGFEVASRVRHTSRLADIPIIMITSRTGDKHRERAYSLGVNKYLGKPYQEITLLQAIAEVMGEAVH